MKDKGKFFGILLPVLFVVIVVVIVLVSSGVLNEVRVITRAVIGVELEEIELIRDGWGKIIWSSLWI